MADTPEVSTSSTPAGEPLDVALRRVPIFEDLEESELHWFAAQAEDLRLAPGEILFPEGAPADSLFVILDGEIRIRRESGGADTPVYHARAGQVTGMLPFSRMSHFLVMSRAVVPSRIARLHKDRFHEMLNRIPKLLPRLVAVLADRIRDVSRADQQREKLTALGKLSAGLAHELNNPASAARRAAETLRHAMSDLRQIDAELDGLSGDQRRSLANFEARSIEKLGSLPAMDSLLQSDLEEEMTAWLDRHSIAESCKLSAGLVEAGITPGSLAPLVAKCDAPIVSRVLAKVVAVLNAEKLTREIEGATGRISELVKAIKEYTYMDRMPEQEIDIHQGIESTLTMLKFRLKKGVNVTREYDRSLPRICAHGSELNQVWTNLIDNAVDAMNGKGELHIRTARELDSLLVEVTDNGSGIPEEMKGRIFEPFFTTKGVGEGTGLGLDTVYRIVRNHHGEITFESKPGETRFQVRLPLSAPREVPS